jgi:site-specific recombinase XerD
LQYKYLLAVHGKDPAEEKRRSLDTLSLKAFCKTEFINHIQSKCKDHNESVRKMNVDLYPYFKGRLLSEISTGDIIRYINRIKKRSSGATANRHLALLSAIYSYAIKLGYIDQSPVKSVDRYQESTGMERFLSDSEIKKLVAALKLANSPVAAAAILLLLATGLRKGECLSLRWSCVDFERQQLKLTMDVTKGGRARTVILSSTAIKILEDLMQYRVDSSDFLFPGAKPGHHLTDVRKTLNTACKRAGINHVRTHDLRHSFCSKLASSGVSLLIIARLVGHRNLKTTERYSHLSEQCLVDANNIMSDALVAA